MPPFPPELEVVVTGMGVVCPLGVGRSALAEAIDIGQSGVRPLTRFDPGPLPYRLAADVLPYNAAEHISPRKAIKVMCPEIQHAMVSARLALDDAGLAAGTVDPDRFGAVFGVDMMFCALDTVEGAYRACTREGQFDFRRWGQQGMPEMFPLNMLKHLPNMPACQAAISFDARGPNNTLAQGEVSSLQACLEGASWIRRGWTDVVLVGATSSRLHPTLWVRSRAVQVSCRNDDPAAACRPFERDRDGLVWGEGAAVLVLESRRHAERRGARVRAALLGGGSRFEKPGPGGRLAGTALRGAVSAAFQDAAFDPQRLGHVNAHGLATTADDACEAAALRTLLPEVPVTAPKSYFGHLGAAGGMVEAVCAVLALETGRIAPTLNYVTPDPDCPIRVVQGEPLCGRPRSALLLNFNPTGQAAAVLLAADEPD